ncbi:1757_t:CDS:2, partial [Funneliformis mosseae]
MVDPKIQSAHANISKRKIVSFSEKLTSSLPNDLEELTNLPLPNDLIFHLEDFVDISNEKPQESHEERYPFLYRINLPKTFKHPNGKKIKVAVICCFCDIPAIRKLCGYISAKVACYRCFKHADYDDNNQLNFGGLDDMNDWFKERDTKEIRNNTSEWKNCRTEEERQKHLSNTL